MGSPLESPCCVTITGFSMQIVAADIPSFSAAAWAFRAGSIPSFMSCNASSLMLKSAIPRSANGRSHTTASSTERAQ
jgi:hypothetical protein